jgi:hypothetical protein
MKERPILFSGDMVRAILEGRKTLTRRLLKPQPIVRDIERFEIEYREFIMWSLKALIGHCPYGQPGDQLWVRETWMNIEGIKTYYKADLKAESITFAENLRKAFDFKWKPSIHMPRWASRILLEIDEIKVERVQDINEDDAKAEGSDFRSYPYKDGNDTRYIESNLPAEYGVIFRNSFAGLWDSIYAKQGAGWDDNPWIWVIKFHRLEAKV